jgi:hypothetical protein
MPIRVATVTPAGVVVAVAAGNGGADRSVLLSAFATNGTRASVSGHCRDLLKIVVLKITRGRSPREPGGLDYLLSRAAIHLQAPAYVLNVLLAVNVTAVKVPSAFAVIPRLMASLLPRLIAVVVAVFMAEIPYLVVVCFSD